MGRKKRFIEEEVLEQSLLLFWKHGYATTTYSMLEEATGLTGRSLINAFGDKEQLYLTVLDNYLTQVNSWAAPYFEKPSVKAIISFFRFISQSPESDPKNNGCLIVNTIFDIEQAPSPIQDKVLQFKNYLLDQFTASLKADDIDKPDEKAQFLLTFMWGASCQIRFSKTVNTINQPLQTLEATLKLWKSS